MGNYKFHKIYFQKLSAGWVCLVALGNYYKLSFTKNPYHNVIPSLNLTDFLLASQLTTTKKK